MNPPAEPEPGSGPAPASPFPREALAAVLARLAAQGLHLGTSSWKYPGWRGQLYDESRYVYRGQFSETRFERLCLAEYARVFKTVCVDAAYYQFPSARYLDGLTGQVPPDFQFAFKVTDEITIKRFPNLPRFGARAGQANPHFLNADRFATAFLRPCEPHRQQVGLLMFEFSRFYPSDFARGRDFVEALDQFLSQLPRGWPYGVEIRNRNFLQADYFATLRRHGVTHVYNSWDAMPALEEQMAMPESVTTDDRVAARLLLKPGRKYEEAVKSFSPYDRLHEVNEPGRQAAARLLQESLVENARRKAFLYVNNRFEGNALQTLIAILARAGLAQFTTPEPAPPERGSTLSPSPSTEVRSSSEPREPLPTPPPPQPTSPQPAPPPSVSPSAGTPQQGDLLL